jgi:hypothetical protein
MKVVVAEMMDSSRSPKVAKPLHVYKSQLATQIDRKKAILSSLISGLIASPARD